jgi:hypothetical protein
LIASAARVTTGGRFDAPAGEGAPGGLSWLVPCRLKKQAAPRPPADPAELTRQGMLGFQARSSFVPVGLFSGLLAAQIVGTGSTAAAIRIGEVDSAYLRLEFQTLYGEGRWETLSLGLTDVADPFLGGTATAIEVWTTSAFALKTVCGDLDRLERDRFPGVVFESRVWFRNASKSGEALVWDLRPSQGSLGAILQERKLNLAFSASVWGGSDDGGGGDIDGLCVSDVVKATSLSFFLSHAWGDWSVRKASRATVTEGLVRSVEERSREAVWTDLRELRDETQLHARMEQGVRKARCVIVCLSRIYLTRSNCLLELCWAVEEHRASGKPLIVVSVDPELTFPAIAGWDPRKDLTGSAVNNEGRTVPFKIDRRTVAFVQKYVPGVNFFDDWKDGEGARSAERERAVRKMLNSLKGAIANPLPKQAAPRLAVKKGHDADTPSVPGTDFWYVEDADA